MVDRIFPSELQLNKPILPIPRHLFLNLNPCISNCTKFMINGTILIVNFPFLDGVVPRRTSYGVYTSQLIRFARASLNLFDSTAVIEPNFLGRVIVMLNFVRRFQNFISDTVLW